MARTRRGGLVSIPPRPDTATDLTAPASGHLAEVDADALLDLCHRLDADIVITAPVGTAVVSRQPIGWISGRSRR